MEIAALTPEYLDRLLEGAPPPLAQVGRAYFSPGSVSLCMLREGEPVFAGGIVNMMWGRGEIWVLPTRFYRCHIHSCFRRMLQVLPGLVKSGGFRRVQATCIHGSPGKWLRVFGFDYEGTLKKFGPNGETCDIYARIFEESV
jgi:hypothetical protein